MLFWPLEGFLLFISGSIHRAVCYIKKSCGPFAFGTLLFRIEGIGLKEFWKREVRIFAGHSKVTKPKY